LATNVPDVLNQNRFVVKEHLGVFKAANEYDIHDPESGEIVMHCREKHLSGFTRFLRFTKYKPNTPFDISITTPDGELLVRVSRGWAWIRSRVAVHDPTGASLGTFRQRLLSIGGAFDVVGPEDQVLCSLKGKLTGWDFRFVADDVELARVTKKWKGLGKELFTSADNYMLVISDEVPANHPLRRLILAAVMCVDMVLKEG
jgi:uncharacterized protein YxjI